MHERLTVMRWFLMSNNLQSNLHAGILAVDVNEGFVYISPQHENGLLDSCHHYQVAFLVSFFVTLRNI